MKTAKANYQAVWAFPLSGHSVGLFLAGSASATQIFGCFHTLGQSDVASLLPFLTLRCLVTGSLCLFMPEMRTSSSNGKTPSSLSFISFNSQSWKYAWIRFISRRLNSASYLYVLAMNSIISELKWDWVKGQYVGQRSSHNVHLKCQFDKT